MIIIKKVNSTNQISFVVISKVFILSTNKATFFFQRKFFLSINDVTQSYLNKTCIEFQILWAGFEPYLWTISTIDWSVFVNFCQYRKLCCLYTSRSFLNQIINSIIWSVELSISIAKKALKYYALSLIGKWFRRKLTVVHSIYIENNVWKTNFLSFGLFEWPLKDIIVCCHFLS